MLCTFPSITLPEGFIPIKPFLEVGWSHCSFFKYLTLNTIILIRRCAYLKVLPKVCRTENHWHNHIGYCHKYTSRANNAEYLLSQRQNILYHFVFLAIGGGVATFYKIQIKYKRFSYMQSILCKNNKVIQNEMRAFIKNQFEILQH